MKAVVGNRHRVTPFNIQNGNQAPYFIVEAGQASKRDEVAKLAQEEFKQRSSLSKFPNWSLEINKI